VGSGQQRQSCFNCPLPTAHCLLLMSTPYNEEKRLTLRMALRLPIVVSGRSEDGAAWSEPTETDDISTGGALFHLNQKVNRGERLYLRAHRPDGAPIEVTVTVARVAPAIYGTARVGVSISEPVENWLRLFVSWVADEQPAQPETESESPTPE
jgi:PilZ domain